MIIQDEIYAYSCELCCIDLKEENIKLISSYKQGAKTLLKFVTISIKKISF